MEDNQVITKPKRGRHPRSCRCPIHTALARATEAQSLTVRDGRGNEILNVDDGGQLFTSKPGSARERIIKWIELKAKFPDLKRKEIAEKMGMTDRGLEALIYKSTKHGWLKFNNPLERLENEIMPKVMDNLSTLMDDKDKTATIETAKATVFKHYQESKGITENSVTVLALKIEHPDPSQVRVIQGSIVGKPRILEES